jgi:hypothetical protein
MKTSGLGVETTDLTPTSAGEEATEEQIENARAWLLLNPKEAKKGQIMAKAHIKHLVSLGANVFITQ